MVLLAGLTVNAGIYIICQLNNQNGKMFVKAFNHKIIPILLTILSTVLGMIPFLIDGPDEQPFWYSLAVGTIGGLVFSIIPILLFLPSVLKLSPDHHQQKRCRQWICTSFILFLNQPVFHVVGFAFALKVELNIVKGVANLLEWGFGVEVGIAIGQ